MSILLIKEIGIGGLNRNFIGKEDNIKTNEIYTKNAISKWKCRILFYI